MGDSNLTAAHTGTDILRLLASNILDRPAFGLLSIVYQLFFNVASATLFSGATIMNFFSRVQLILGVFTMFQLAMSILKGIVNPDNFFGKDKGVKSIISRIVIALIMLTLITPISIPAAKNEYEKQINNNGILFGTLYSLQHRLLSNNTIGRLILGTTDTSPSYISSDSDDELKTSSRIFTSTVLKAFYRINLIDYDSRKHEAGKDDAVFNENRVCQDIDDDVLASYTRLDADPGEIIDMATVTCNSDGGFIKSVIRLFKKLTGSEYYVFAYTPILGAIVAFIFSFILLSFTVDVAVRAVKLSVLRLIAPIPIISYMNPNGSKDNAFNSWVKMLTTTYLDLFVRLAVVYFVIFLIQDMIANGLSIKTLNGQAGIFSLIIIWIGLFIFAKQAPKFFKDVLGLKNEPGKLFGGFGEVLGVGAIGAGAIGAFNAARVGSRMADETNHKDPNSIINRGKHLLAGMVGGVTGVSAAAKAWSGAKDHPGSAVIQAYQKQNATKYSQGDAGSTLFGRIGTTGSRLFTGESTASRNERNISNLEARQSALDAVKKRVSGEMVKQDWTYGSLGINRDNNGNTIGNVNYKSFMAEYEAAKSRGDGIVKFTDQSGTQHEINFADADRQKGFLLKNNEDSYIREIVSGNNGHTDVELTSLIQDAQAKGGAYLYDNATNSYRPNTSGGVINSRDSYTKTSEGIGQEVRDAKRANSKAKADDMYAGKK